MRCDFCDQAEAVSTHELKGNRGNFVVCLCAACAISSGIITDTEAQHMDGTSPGTGKQSSKVCRACGMTIYSLRTQRLAGCARCWTTFGDELRSMVRGIHQDTQYRGKRIPCQEKEESLSYRRERLQQLLAAAISSERFEEAARLRDQLRELG